MPVRLVKWDLSTSTGKVPIDWKLSRTKIQYISNPTFRLVAGFAKIQRESENPGDSLLAGFARNYPSETPRIQLPKNNLFPPLSGSEMTISLTCTCSARLEVDEKFTGQTITCPDCQSPIHVPKGDDTEPVRTSSLALASVGLALVGAFTVFGTLLAIFLGVAAWLIIRQNPDRLAGKSYALTGIVLGSLFTIISLFAFSSAELFGLDTIFRQQQWAGMLDYEGDLTIERPTEGFRITRPSQEWGVLRNPPKNPFEVELQDFMMVNPDKAAHVFCLPIEVEGNPTLDECETRGLRVFKSLELRNSNLIRSKFPTVHLQNKRNRRQVIKGNQAFIEVTIDKVYRGQEKTFLFRVIKKQNSLRGDDLIYVVAGGTAKARFRELKGEIKGILDSFQFVDRLP